VVIATFLSHAMGFDSALGREPPLRSVKASAEGAPSANLPSAQPAAVEANAALHRAVGGVSLFPVLRSSAALLDLTARAQRREVAR